MLGVDIVYIPRFRRILNAAYGHLMIERIFSQEEYDISKNCKIIDNKIVIHLSGIFAAKEAVIKASLGMLKLDDMKRIIICNSAEGAPYAKIIDNESTVIFDISISHDQDYAVAIAQRKDRI